MLLCIPGSWVSSPVVILSNDQNADLHEADFYAPDPFGADAGLRTVALPFGKSVRFGVRYPFDGIYPSDVSFRGTPGATFLAVDPDLTHGKDVYPRRGREGVGQLPRFRSPFAIAARLRCPLRAARDGSDPSGPLATGMGTSSGPSWVLRRCYRHPRSAIRRCLSWHLQRRPSFCQASIPIPSSLGTRALSRLQLPLCLHGIRFHPTALRPHRTRHLDAAQPSPASRSARQVAPAPHAGGQPLPFRGDVCGPALLSCGTAGPSRFDSVVLLPAFGRSKDASAPISRRLPCLPRPGSCARSTGCSGWLDSATGLRFSSATVHDGRY